MPRRSIVWICLTLCLGAAGCTAMRTATAPLPEQQEMTQTESYLLDVRSGWGASQKHVKPLRTGMTVHDALVDSGLSTRFNSVKIDLVRKTPAPSGAVKLACEFDHKANHVRFEQDYALHPGDVVVIEQQMLGPVEQVMRFGNSNR